ncbi:B3 domain-containing protein Os04g0386900-like [Phalaenopsis equestris]|uniref:B3 domain-containing protein Os04g0386900-like n=1 Tax=Phalaenopsis equestris TaxID=78828 RepID=UPI0009E46FE9|nr:B3 domain-containing protein Os04g0386900-like [Phalaenopsis equestris]
MSDILENESKSQSNCSQKLQQEQSLSTQESNNAGPPVSICSTPLTGNPYFTSVVVKSQVEAPYQLVVPAWFRKSLPKATIQAYLVHKGKTWEMKYYGESRLKRLGCGWKKFALENNLKVGDGCVFELMDDDKELRLGVQILNGQIPVEFIRLGSAEKPIIID